MTSSAVLDCTLLSRSGSYRITGETGQWRYSYEEFEGRKTYYTFWRNSQVKEGERVWRRLSQEKVYERVTEITSQPRYKPIDLSQFESFRGQ